MSTEPESQDMPGPTKPVEEHNWLQNLVGEWKSEAEMMMPDGTTATAEGAETVTNLGGLWAFAEGTGTMPDGGKFVSKFGLGYDVSFKEYRGFWIANMSSHLWNYKGTLSEDGKKMTLDCVGPSMVTEGETANYRDVHDIIDANTRTMTSFGQDDNGEWQQFMQVTYRRA